MLKFYQCGCWKHNKMACFRARFRVVLTKEAAKPENLDADGNATWIVQGNNLYINSRHAVTPTEKNPKGQGSMLRTAGQEDV